MNIFLAYLLAFLMGPTIGGMAGILLLQFRTFGMLIGYIVIGFVSVWLGSFVFSLFGLRPTVLMVIIIGVGFLMNHLNRLRKVASASPEQFQIELAGTVGSLVGVVVSGIYLLSHIGG